MPYDINNPPEKLRKLSDKKKRQWVSVFNSCYDKHGDEARCHKMAWGVVGKSVDCDNGITGLSDFMDFIVKMAPVGIPGARGNLGSGEQWHEIESLPGYVVRYVGQGKDRKMIKKPKSGSKGVSKPVGGKMSKHEGFPPVSIVYGMTLDPETGTFLITAKFRGKTQKLRIKPDDIKKLPNDWQTLLTPESFGEAKMDSNTGSMVASTEIEGKKIDLKFNPDDASKLPDNWQKHFIRVASSKHVDGILKYLHAFSDAVKSGKINKAKKKEETGDAEAKIDITTPGGARAMALTLTRLFGGWNGGCRLSPSANRVDTYHVSVFCETPQELGQRILDLQSYLTAEGYNEVSEGVYSHGNKAVFVGRSYSRKKGKRPLVFMITVRTV